MSYQKNKPSVGRGDGGFYNEDEDFDRPGTPLWVHEKKHGLYCRVKHKLFSVSHHSHHHSHGTRNGIIDDMAPMYSPKFRG